MHQPEYIPYMGFFHRLVHSDVFVVLDNVQFDKRAHTHRNKIRTPKGCMWLTIPLINAGRAKIKDVKINNDLDWVDKHLKAFQHNYSKSSYFKDYFPFLEKIYRKRSDLLADFDNILFEFIKNRLNINIEVVKSSDLNVRGRSTNLLVNICRKIGADTYLSGPFGRKYLDEHLFAKEGIDLIYQKFNHPIYKQRFKDFIPNLSIIDLLFNHGKDSVKIIKQNDKQ